MGENKKNTDCCCLLSKVLHSITNFHFFLRKLLPVPVNMYMYTYIYMYTHIHVCAVSQKSNSVVSVFLKYLAISERATYWLIKFYFELVLKHKEMQNIANAKAL